MKQVHCRHFVTTESSACNYLQLDLLHPPTYILAAISFELSSKLRYGNWSVTFPSSCCFQQSKCDFTLPDGSRQWWTSYRACFVFFVDYLCVFNKLLFRDLRVIFETHSIFLFFDKIRIISFCNYPLFLQFRCIVFSTDS